MKFVTILFSVLYLFCTPVQAKQILIFGDSLSAAYGIDPQEGWVHLLGQELTSAHTVVNASISGEDTVTGLARLPAVIEASKPDLVFIELGGNDGLRAYKLEQTRANLASMIELVREHGAQPVLAGIRVPPNYGPRYVRGFAELFPTLAAEKNVPYVDMYIEEIATDPTKVQPDGIHPVAAVQDQIMRYILDFLNKERLLEE